MTVMDFWNWNSERVVYCVVVEEEATKHFEEEDKRRRGREGKGGLLGLFFFCLFSSASRFRSRSRSLSLWFHWFAFMALSFSLWSGFCDCLFLGFVSADGDGLGAL